MGGGRTGCLPAGYGGGGQLSGPLCAPCQAGRACPRSCLPVSRRLCSTGADGQGVTSVGASQEVQWVIVAVAACAAGTGQTGAVRCAAPCHDQQPCDQGAECPLPAPARQRPSDLRHVPWRWEGWWTLPHAICTWAYACPLSILGPIACIEQPT